MKRKSMKKVSAKIKSRKWTNGSSMINAYRTNRKLKQNGGTLDADKYYGMEKVSAKSGKWTCWEQLPLHA